MQIIILPDVEKECSLYANEGGLLHSYCSVVSHPALVLVRRVKQICDLEVASRGREGRKLQLKMWESPSPRLEEKVAGTQLEGLKLSKASCRACCS